MVNFQLFQVASLRSIKMMKKVVHKVIALVSNQIANQERIGDVKREDAREWQVEEHIQSNVSWNRREDKAILVHWEAVVDAVDSVVEGVKEPWLGDVSHPVVFPMENEPVEHVLRERPEHYAS